MLESIMTVDTIGTGVDELTEDEFSGIATGSHQRPLYRISKDNPDYCPRFLFLQKVTEIKDATILQWDYSKGPNICVNFGSSGGIEPFTLTENKFATMDLLLAGEPRVWVIVSSQHREPLVKMLIQEGMTSQEFFLSPKLLLALNIPITVAVQKPGEMMIIRAGALTQVTNRGWSSSLIVRYAEESQLQPSCTLVHGCHQERSRRAGRTLSLPEWKKRAYSTWFPHPGTCKFCTRIFQNYIQVVNHELKHERESSQCPGCVWLNLTLLTDRIRARFWRTYFHLRGPREWANKKSCLGQCKDQTTILSAQVGKCREGELQTFAPIFRTSGISEENWSHFYNDPVFIEGFLDRKELEKFLRDLLRKGPLLIGHELCSFFR